MHLSRPSVAAFCLLLSGAALAGCGGGSTSTTSTSSAPVASRPAPSKSDFPGTAGKSLGDVLSTAADGPSQLFVAPAAEVFYKGENRYPFGVFTRERTQVPDAQIALYISKVPPQPKGHSAEPGKTFKASKKALDEPATGPFPAAIQTLATQPAFRSKTTANDPNATGAVYTANIDFPSKGLWRVAALIKWDGTTTAKVLASAGVGEFTKVPRVGDPAPLIHTPTAASVGGDLSKVTTRIPPDTQNKVDYADVLGKEPIVLLFATPQFCQSRVCGPVVDVAEQVKRQYGDKAAFIHMEIYNDNDPSKHVRPQVRAFHLPTEPWLFVIDRHGTVRTALEGPFSVAELTHAVKAVTGG